MTTLVLLRHGTSTANTAGVLAGRSPGVALESAGVQQAEDVAKRLSHITFDRLICSPMQRCQQTLEPLSASTGLAVELDDQFAEVDYGEWSGRELKDLAKEKLWATVQAHPSAAVFPGGEGLAAVSARAVAGVRDLIASSADDAVILVCSHGDVIKAILADALGLHLDGFQRIVVAPASISIIRYTPHRPFVEKINDSAELGTLRPPAPAASTAEATSGTDSGADSVLASSDAVPGGVTS